MNKIIVAIIASMILLPTMAAQDTWKPPTPRNELNIRMGEVSLTRQGYMYILYAKTDNIFDEHGMSIFIGKGREEALESINKLIEISELPVGNILPYREAKVQTFHDHIKIIEVKDKIFFGKASIYLVDLKRIKKFIEKGK